MCTAAYIVHSILYTTHSVWASRHHYITAQWHATTRLILSIHMQKARACALDNQSTDRPRARVVFPLYVYNIILHKSRAQRIDEKMCLSKRRSGYLNQVIEKEQNI